MQTITELRISLNATTRLSKAFDVSDNRQLKTLKIAINNDQRREMLWISGS